VPGSPDFPKERRVSESKKRMTPLHLPIAAPCRERFEEMCGEGATRYCEKCQKPVHDLSASTEPQARALLREHAGKRLCVRYAKDATGRLRFKTALLATAVSVAACGTHATEPPAATGADHLAMKCRNPAIPNADADAGAQEEVFMGDIAAPSEE